MDHGPGPCGDSPASPGARTVRGEQAGCGGTGPLPMVTSPRISLSTHTTAPGAIFTLRGVTGRSRGPAEGPGGDAGRGRRARGWLWEGSEENREGSRGDRGGSALTSFAPSPPWSRPAAPARGGAPGVRGRARPRPLLREHREHRGWGGPGPAPAPGEERGSAEPGTWKERPTPVFGGSERVLRVRA